MGDANTGRSAVMRTVIALTASLSLLIGIGSAVATVRWVDLRNEGTIVWEPRDAAGEGEAEGGPCSEDPCNYLLLGSDSREGLPSDVYGTDAQIGGTNRADTIMLVHVDPRLDEAIVLSFPRDLWVRIPGHGFDRINTAFEGGPLHGGPQLMADTVANLTGLSVDHFLYVDLAGFRDVVNTIGGVDMCLPAYNVNTPGWLPANLPGGEPTQVYVDDVGHIADVNAGLNIRPGCQRLDGSQALAYVRARHLPCDHIPDFARIGRQQQFLRALINQMLQPSKIVQAPALVPEVVEQLRRDEGFLPSDLVHLVGQLRGLTTGAVEFRAVPGVAAWEGEKSVVRMDPAAKELFAAIRHGRPIGSIGSQLVNTPPSEANTIVAVVDARSDGAVDAVAGVLADAGFDVTPGIWAADEGPNVDGPAIVFGPGAEDHARVVGAYFPDIPIVGPRDLSGTDVAVVVPRSYEPVPPNENAGEAPGGNCPTPVV